MKLLQFSNKTLLQFSSEVAMLKEPANSVGADKTLVLNDNSQLADADIVLLGNIGYPRAECANINAAVSEGTDIRVDNISNLHSVGDKVTKIEYDQIKFYHDTVATGATKSLLATVDISFDEEFTTYKDATYTTGYAFFTLYNSVTAVESGTTIAIPYTALETIAKQKIRDLVKEFFPNEFSDDVFDMLLEVREKAFYAKRKWTMREKIWTFNTVIDQQAYPFADNSLTDLKQILSATYDTYPIRVIPNSNFVARIAGSVASGTPVAVHVWDKSLYFDPTPSAAEEAKIFGYKAPPGMDDETSETELEIPQCLAFGILQDLFAGVDRNKSLYWGQRAMELMMRMEQDDEKDTEQGSAFESDASQRILRDYTLSE